MKTKLLISACLLVSSLSGNADTGNFQISNTNLKDLFNSDNGTGVVKPTPWAGSYWAYGTDGLANKEDREASPSAKYDAFVKQGKKATKWEEENHSCKNVDASMKEGCKGWWGHCNAWAAAAIIHEEPRKSRKLSGTEFEVADQKAYLTELWMSSGSLFAGNTNKSIKTGAWVCDPNSREAKQKDSYGVSNYEKFWDLSPRDFFLIMTNYVGLRSSGIVIDRFTGDEVWNQPVVGYRMEPLTADDVGTDESSGQHYVKLTMKIYWAHDGVDGNAKAAIPFDIMKIDNEYGSIGNGDRNDPNQLTFGASYESRVLQFKLFTSSEVKIKDGKIASAGRIVGEGVWEHQENCSGASVMDQSHPDFAWRPTTLESWGDSNPYIKADVVTKIVEASGGGGGGGGGNEEGDGQNLFKVKFSLDYLSGRTQLAARRYIKKMFRRAEISVDIDELSMNGRQVFATLTFPDGVTEQTINDILTENGAVQITVTPQ
jgi:hypothetical protein